MPMIHKRLHDLWFAATGMTQAQLTQIAVRLHHSFVLAIAEPQATACPLSTESPMRAKSGNQSSNQCVSNLLHKRKLRFTNVTQHHSISKSLDLFKPVDRSKTTHILSEQHVFLLQNCRAGCHSTEQVKIQKRRHIFSQCVPTVQARQLCSERCEYLTGWVGQV